MSRILVLGHGPLPTENELKLFGPGIRTWQFAQPLIEDRHQVTVVCSRIPFVYDAHLPAVVQLKAANADIFSVDQGEFELGTFVQDLHDRFNPDCIVAATAYPSFVASRLRSDRPLWVDFFGDTMAEAQAKARTYHDDGYLRHFRTYLDAAMDRADIFSAVSGPQRFSLIGQLGLHGRLNQYSSGFEFVHTIPCAIEELPEPTTRSLLRSGRLKKDDFAILWSGGYNTWTDVETLFCGLEMAMRSNSRIQFVSTGGQIDGHDEVTYPHFLSLIAASPFRERFIMLGWVLTEDVASYTRECDLGINIDAQTYEAVLGSRNRILQWMGAGLPVLTTETSEITTTVRVGGLGYTFPHQDAPALSDAILQIADNATDRLIRAERALAHVHRHWTFATTTEPLRRWVRAPTIAPDRERNASLVTGAISLPAPPGDVIEEADDARPQIAASVPPSTSKPAGLSVRRTLLAMSNAISRAGYRTRVNVTRKHLEHSVEIRYDGTPCEFDAGHRVAVPLVVRNRGSLAWEPGSVTDHQFNVSYHWHDARGRLITYDGERTPIPAIVDTGEDVKVMAWVIAPASSGIHRLEWDLVHENVTWFGAPPGTPTLRIVVNVRRDG